MTREKELELRGKCKTCKFFQRQAEAQAQGLCKENSPQVTVVLLPQQNALTREVGMTPVPVGAFPTVQDEEWCGRHQFRWAVPVN